MCQIIEYTEGSDLTREDVDLLPWNFEETEVIEEAMQSPKQVATVIIVEEDGASDHVNLYSVAKEEDDDCAIPYELDEVDEDCSDEADQELAPADDVAAAKVPREDVNLYSQDYQRTMKEIERKEKLEVGTLDDSLMDLSRYHSPTRNAKKFYAPASIGKINSPGIFNFEAKEDLFKSSIRVADKSNGHAIFRDVISNNAATPIRRRHSSVQDIEDEKTTSDDFKAGTAAADPFRPPFGRRHSLMTAKVANEANEASDYTASPFIRPYARRHSLMTAEDIEGETVANDEFQANSYISPTQLKRASVDSTSRPGLHSPGVFDNDYRNIRSDQAQADDEDYGYSISHSSRYSVLQDEDDDDDCASFYEVDEFSEDSFAKAEQEWASQEYQRSKQEIERREKLEIRTLDDSLMDLSMYQSPTKNRSPTKNAKKFYSPAKIGKIDSPEIFNFGVVEDPVDSAKMREKKAHMNSLRPGMMRGSTFGSDSDDEDDEDDDDVDDDVDDDDEEAVSKPIHNLRPGMIRGRSYVEDSSRPESSTLRIDSLRPGRRRGTAIDNSSDNDTDDDDDDDDDEEAVSKPIHNLRPGVIRGRSYVEDGPRSESFTPSLRPGRRRGTAIGNGSDADDDSDGDDDDDDDDGDDGDDGDDEGAVSKPVHNLRPGMIRGRSYVEDDPRYERSPPRIDSLRPGRRRGTAFDNDGDYGDNEEAVSKPVHSLRPGTTRGRSYVEDSPRPKSNMPRSINIRGSSNDGDDNEALEKPQKLKDAEEMKAKVGLVKLLGQDSKQEKAPVYLKSFSSLRNGYISAVDKLRPQSKPFLVQTEEDQKEEASKVQKYGNLKNAWDTYEDAAQDKPDSEEFTPQEKAAEEKVIEVETSVNRDWQEYADAVVKVVQNDVSSDEESEGDDKCDLWILEAKRVEAEAERKKAKEERKRKKSDKKKRRKEDKAQQKDLEAEHGNRGLLKEKTTKKKEVERKAKSSKTKESKEDSTDIKDGGKVASGVDEEERKQRKEERRQKREAAKSKDTSAEDVKEIVVDTSDDARRRQLAFSWYSQMSEPDRSEFKRKVAALHSLNITPDDVDLLPWNATGSVVDVAKMNTLTKANLIK
jgi:hypothetical protein